MVLNAFYFILLVAIADHDIPASYILHLDYKAVSFTYNLNLKSAQVNILNTLYMVHL